MSTIIKTDLMVLAEGILTASINYDLLVTIVLAAIISSMVITSIWFVFNSLLNMAGALLAPHPSPTIPEKSFIKSSS